MGSRITYDEVAKIADQMVERGQEVSVIKMREALGGRGSYATITKYVNQWRDSTAQLSAISQRTLPNALHAAVCAHVDEEVGRVHERYAQDLKCARQAVEDIAKQHDRLQDEKDAAAERIRSLEAEHLKLNGRLERMSDELATLKNDVQLERSASSSLKRKLVAASVRLEQHGKVVKQVEQLRSALEAARSAQAQAEHQVEMLELEIKLLNRQPVALANASGIHGRLDGSKGNGRKRAASKRQSASHSEHIGADAVAEQVHPRSSDPRQILLPYGDEAEGGQASGQMSTASDPLDVGTPVAPAG